MNSSDFQNLYEFFQLFYVFFHSNICKMNVSLLWSILFRFLSHREVLKIPAKLTFSRKCMYVKNSQVMYSVYRFEKVEKILSKISKF